MLFLRFFFCQKQRSPYRIGFEIPTAKHTGLSRQAYIFDLCLAMAFRFLIGQSHGFLNSDWSSKN